MQPNPESFFRRALRAVLAAPGDLRKRRSLRKAGLSARDLDDHILRDIGLDRPAGDETPKRLQWNAPVHWYDPGSTR